jgi:hypothetical protein
MVWRGTEKYQEEKGDLARNRIGNTVERKKRLKTFHPLNHVRQNLKQSIYQGIMVNAIVLQHYMGKLKIPLYQSYQTT